MRTFVELGFIGRLKKASDFLQAEIYFFKELIENYGRDACNVPNYSVSVETQNWGSGTVAVLVKVLGDWKPLWLHFPTPNAVVLCDRSP